jgi:hypothetical protein
MFKHNFKVFAITAIIAISAIGGLAINTANRPVIDDSIKTDASETNCGEMAKDVDGDVLLTRLYDKNGNSFNIREGDKLYISFAVGSKEYNFYARVSDSTDLAAGCVRTLDDLAAVIERSLNNAAEISGAAVIVSDGCLLIANADGAINLWVGNLTRASSNVHLTKSFLWLGQVKGASTGKMLAL